MKLSFDDIKNIVFGSEKTSQGDYISFYRFSEKEKLAYSSSEGFTNKTYATAGIRFDFYTDASSISFDYKMIRASSRNFAIFDIYINGIFTDAITHLDVEVEFTDSYRKKLPEGKKRITIFLPNLYSMQIKNFVLEDATVLEPYEYKMKIVSYGDSITQGYDARFPSYSYINQLSIKLDAFVYNKAIGGDIFRPDLLENKAFMPDIVTVAYGTNDWVKSSREEFSYNMRTFIKNIAMNYTTSKIFVITPIWRRDYDKIVPLGTLDEVVNAISNECVKYSNIKVITGTDCLPHTDLLFSKDGVHPNDLGMLTYSSNLYKKILSLL